jgi:hypothetical protein
MAVDLGLAGMGAFGTESTLGTVLFSALSGAGSSTGFVSGASIASLGSPGILPPVPFGSATGGTLAVLPSGTGAPSAGASSAPGSAGGQAAALQNGSPGSSGAAPVAPPAPVAPAAPGGGAPAPGIAPAGAQPDQQLGGRYEPRWGIAPSMPGGSMPQQVWVDLDDIKRRHAAAYKEYLEGREVLKEIYQEYGRIYLQNPEKQLWAGLATHAGSLVVVAMYDEIERNQQAGLSWRIDMSDLCDEFQRLIVKMAKAIRDDVGTQAAVFGSEGIDGIRRMGLEDPENLKAWESIARGDVVAGAEYLAQREQTVVLNKYYKDILNLCVALAPAMSIRAISGFEELGCPRFTCAMGVWPYASFTDTDGPGANDRWTYIRDSILPIWTGMNVDQRTEWVKKRLDIIRNSQEAKYDGF